MPTRIQKFKTRNYRRTGKKKDKRRKTRGRYQKKRKKDCVKFKEGDMVYKPPMVIPGMDKISKGKVGTVVSISKNCKWCLVIFNTGRDGIGMYNSKSDIVNATELHKTDHPPNNEDPPLDAKGVEDAKKDFHRINDNRD